MNGIQVCNQLTTQFTGVDSPAENTTDDEMHGGESRPYRLSELLGGPDGIGLVRLAHTVSSEAAEMIGRTASIGKSIGRYARPSAILESTIRSVKGAKTLPSWQLRGVIRPH